MPAVPASSHRTLPCPWPVVLLLACGGDEPASAETSTTADPSSSSAPAPTTGAVDPTTGAVDPTTSTGVEGDGSADGSGGSSGAPACDERCPGVCDDLLGCVTCSPGATQCD